MINNCYYIQIDIDFDDKNEFYDLMIKLADKDNDEMIMVDNLLNIFKKHINDISRDKSSFFFVDLSVKHNDYNDLHKAMINFHSKENKTYQPRIQNVFNLIFDPNNIRMKLVDIVQKTYNESKQQMEYFDFTVKDNFYLLLSKYKSTFDFTAINEILSKYQVFNSKVSDDAATEYKVLLFYLYISINKNRNNEEMFKQILNKILIDSDIDGEYNMNKSLSIQNPLPVLTKLIYFDYHHRIKLFHIIQKLYYKAQQEMVCISLYKHQQILHNCNIICL